MKKNANRLGHLSPRELQILKLIVNDIPNKNIATELGLSRRTVEAHRLHLMKKLGIKSIIGLFKYAVKNKMVKV